MFYLGVDGGGTKTSFILINEQGRIVGHAVQGSSHYLQVQFSGMQQVLTEGIRQICRQAGIEITEIAYSFLGIPAFGEIEKNVPLLEAVVEKVLQSTRFCCGNDVEAGWAGSLACRPGVNIVAGTGAIGFGKDSFNNKARAGGWGDFCGDEGSAFWLGKQLISLFGKEADGREPKTPLYDIVRQELNIARDFDFIAMIYDTFQCKRDKIARLAILVHQAAKQGDSKALALYDQAAYEHSLTVKSILRQLHFTNQEEVLVSYSGGVFKAGDLILSPLKKYLGGNRTRLIPPRLLPVSGAALYAMILAGKSVNEPLIDELKKQEAMVITQ